MTFSKLSKTLLLLLLLPFAAGCKTGQNGAKGGETAADTATAVSFNADSALTLVRQQCDFGPRTPGSEAHRRCGDFIVGEFQKRGLEVTEQKVVLETWDKKRFECRNIIAAYAPEKPDRIVIAAHWDSRPWADNDPNPDNHGKPVLAANDGASGVAVMLEVASCLSELKPDLGIDFVCFDLEDYGAPDSEASAPQNGSDWCLGSQYWAGRPHRDNYAPRYGVLLDMVGAPGARFRYEGISMQFAQSTVARVWAAARTAGFADYFPQEDGGYVTDDHKPMNEAGIPTADIIHTGPQGGFATTWHTINDTPDHIDPKTLKAVGQTLVQLIFEETL